MANKTITELLTVTSALNDDDRLLISQNADKYYVSKQIRYETLEKKILDNSYEYSNSLVKSLSSTVDKNFSKSDRTYEKEDVDNKIQIESRRLSDEFDTKLTSYALDSKVFKVIGSQANSTSSSVELDERFGLLDAYDAALEYKISDVSSEFNGKYVKKDNVVTWLSNDSSKVQTANVVYDIAKRLSTVEDETNGKSTVKYDPNPDIAEQGNNIGTLTIDGTSTTLYSGQPDVDATLRKNPNGEIGCDTGVMATITYVDSKLITPETKITNPLIDVPLLTPLFFDYAINNLQWVRSDQTWKKGDDYSEIYKHLLNDYNSSETTEYTDKIGSISITYKLASDGHKICAAGQYESLYGKNKLYSTTGIAWYYVLDTTNKRFILPSTKFGFQGYRNSVGRYLKPGLPDITSSIYCQTAGNHSHSTRIPISNSDDYGSAGCDNSDEVRTYVEATTTYAGEHTHIISLASHDIYGKSSTVQVPATEMYLYFCTGVSKEYLEKKNYDNEVWKFQYVDSNGEVQTVEKHIVTTKVW